VVGHDWGGVVAWRLAGQQPERVATLTAVSTPHPRAFAKSLVAGTQALRSAYIPVFRLPRLPELLLGAHRQWGLRRLLAQDGLGVEWVDTYARALAQPDALSAALAWYRAATPFSLGAPRVSVPTLYVWGSGDPALGPRAAITTGRWVTGPYRFEVIAGAGHWLPEHHAGELGRLLLDHLDGGRPGEQRREGGPAIRQGSEPGGDPPKAARRRPPGTEHGSRREEPHRRKRVGKPERPLPVSPTGSYCQAAALS
jgi:pimeloyl-ACP methyl ester carboxylesterase